MDFPHLSDTNFPLLDNVNVYSYRNQFDYTRWKPNTRVTLTNVLWDSDYNDVVKFDSNERRDEWFDTKQERFQVTLTSDHSLPPEGGIKLPIPFDVANRFNYMYVEVPMMTSADDPIEYESEDGLKRWYFFVDDVSSRAPNTTMFHLSLDVWAQFHNDLTIKYMFLERGHAPVAASDTDAYLSDPLNNNEYLLAPDITPSNASVTRENMFIPFGDGVKYVCIASTCAPSQLASLGGVIHGSADYTFGNISYSDVDARYGYQLQVNGYGIGNGDDYGNLRAPSNPINKGGRIANNVTCYAIAASQVYGNGTFFDSVMSTCPQFMRTIQGCFIATEEMLSFGSSYTLAGHTLMVCNGRDTTIDLPTLTKDDFKYPARYQRFAKLYTYPYASIELTDNEGNVRVVRIENTSKMQVHKIAEVAFPFVSTRMYFTGINGSGSSTYSWKELDGSTIQATIPDSDWFDYCFDHEIPCYALYMDAETAWYLDNFNSTIRSARLGHLAAYHNSVRSANTARANAVDSNDTAYKNTDADATTLTTNTANTTATNSANTNATVATNSAKTAQSNSTSTANDSENRTTASWNNTAAAEASITTTAEEQQVTSSSAWNTGFGQVAGSIGATAAAGAMYGMAAGSVAPGAGNLAGLAAGAAVGTGVGIVQTAASWAAGMQNAQLTVQASSATLGASLAASNASYAANVSGSAVITQNLNTERTQHTNQDNSLLQTHTANNNANLTENNGNTATTMRNNMNRTRNTSNANAGHTREASVLNAKETLESARNPAQFALYDKRNGAPVPVGSYAGDPTSDYMRTRGVQMRVRTMPDSDVRQVGDWFTRYGYAANMIWDVDTSGLCPMKYFCYWKCADVWVDDRESSNSMATSMVSTMLTRGVTVWNNPDEVGRVNVYDN